MNYFTVPLLKPGRYRLSDGQVVAYSKKDAQHVCNQGNKQIQSGLAVPLSWMHDPEAEPQYLSNKNGKPHSEAWVAKNYFGNVIKYEVSPQGEAVAIVKIDDIKDADQFRKVGKVSPCLLNNWTDEKGVKWPGLTVMHVASTPKPIQRELGYVSKLSHSAKGNRNLQLLSQITTNITPWSESMDDEKKGKGVSKGGDFAKLVALMNENGMSVGDPSDMDQLMVGLKAHFDTKNGGSMVVEDDVMDFDDDMDDMDDMEEDLEEGEEVNLGDDLEYDNSETVVPPMMMSHNFYKMGVSLEVKNLTDRVNALAKTARIDVATKEKLIAEVNKHGEKLSAVNLSHKNSGKVLDEKGNFKKATIHTKIETLEMLPTGKFGKKVKLSHTSIVQPPEDRDHDSDVKKAIAERNRMLGLNTNNNQ